MVTTQQPNMEYDLVKTLAPYNINVNAICLTTVDTDMINNQAFYNLFPGGPGSNATREYVIVRMNEVNLFRDRGMLAPEDISAAVLLLVSEEARHITGYAMPIDTGFLTKY